jgi:quinone-modifying oxidoreductase, subunit QmoB
MEEKIGVFICTGYGIGESLDLDALQKVVTDELAVPFCTTVPSCEESCLDQVRQAIESESLTKVLIAGTSSRSLATDPFPKEVIVEYLPLRELVVWTQPPQEEDTQMLGEDYLRMYITKLQKMEAPEPYQSDEPLDKSLLVVGGGITGLTAAVEAAKAGYEVKLVEQSAQLGGWLARQHLSIPTRSPYQELEPTGIESLIQETENHPAITVYTSASTKRIVGAPGLFDVALQSTGNGTPAGEEIAAFRAGAVVQATGWHPKEPENVDHLGYGVIPDVIRNFELEDMVKKDGKITRPSDGKEATSVAFIQWAGSADKDQFSFCSSIVDLTSLKQASYLRQQDPDAKAYIFYDFFRTPGQYEDFYRHVQEDPGVFLTKGEVTKVEPDGEALLLTVQDTMLGKNIQVKADLVVLATGMVPNAADGEAIREYEEAKVVAETGESDAQRAAAADKVEALKRHEGTEILNLEYRQGPDLPALEYGFPDSHFICFPYETRRTGVYAAGAARQPMDGVESREDATGAALKAIQCVELTARGEAVHPRSGDMSYPDFFLQKCTQCKRCTEECPFGVLNEDEKGTPLVWPTRCRRCGVCMGACPERIVSFKDYSVNIITSMIKAVEIPDEYDEKPRILALLCENDAIPALELAGRHGLKYTPFVRVIPVRCLGSINIVWITEALSAGYDGIILVGCKYGDDYQCHFIRGSELAETRGENVREKLQAMALEDERVQLHQLQISEYEKLPKIFDDFAEMIEDIGMNPFKGM